MFDPLHGIQLDKRALLQMLSGFQPAQVLMTAVELDVFNELVRGPATAQELAQQLHCHPHSLALLLQAAVSLGLLEKEGESFRNSAAIEEYLVEGKPNYIGNLAKLQAVAYRRWGQLPRAVRTNCRVDDPILDRGEDPSWARRFTLGMRDIAVDCATMLAESLDLSGRRRLFDVGGGPGVYAIALAQRNPHLRVVVFDLPLVVIIAQQEIERAGLRKRVSTQAGDFHQDDFGEDNDVVLISGVLCSENLLNRRMLLEKAYYSLLPGGLLVVHEFLLNPTRTGPPEATLFSLNLLLATSEGEAYTAEEIMSWLSEAGFVQPRVKSLSAPCNSALITAEKP
jgi:ubiquinone/menaquinone biosynthesis C-methylase UbiE